MSKLEFRTVAGLDLSLRNAGVAIIDAPRQSRCYSFGYDLSSKATHRDMLERVVFIANNIVRVLKSHEVGYVGIENYGFASKGRISMQADLGGVVKSQIFIMGIWPILMAATMVRKFVCGVSPRKNPKQIVLNNLLDLGYEKPRNFDESDALAVAHVVAEFVNNRANVTDEYKLDVFSNIEANLKRGV